MNKAQKIILAIGLILLGVLLLFPPWQQAAFQEAHYRKNIGRGFILHPPKPVAIDCYFVGCQTAPPSHFHVVLYLRLLIAQCGTLLCIILSAMWIFRGRRDNSPATLKSPKRRLIFSMVIALAVPPSGDFPLASLLSDIPRQVMHRDELWLMPVLFLLFVFAFCTGIVYFLLTFALRLSETGDGRAVS